MIFNDLYSINKTYMYIIIFKYALTFIKLTKRKILKNK